MLLENRCQASKPSSVYANRYQLKKISLKRCRSVQWARKRVIKVLFFSTSRGDARKHLHRLPVSTQRHDANNSPPEILLIYVMKNPSGCFVVYSWKYFHFVRFTELRSGSRGTRLTNRLISVSPSARLILPTLMGNGDRQHLPAIEFVYLLGLVVLDLRKNN